MDIQEKLTGRRLTTTERLIINEIVDESIYNPKLVRDIIIRYNDRLKDLVMHGETVDIGRVGIMKLVENKYRNVSDESGIHKGSKKHKWRGKMKFSQAFSREVGEREDEITFYINGSNGDVK